jgi:hypothetical protein
MGKEIKEVGSASYMPATEGFTMVCFKAEDVPEGCKVYILKSKSDANKQAAECELPSLPEMDDMRDVRWGYSRDTVVDIQEDAFEAGLEAGRESRRCEAGGIVRDMLEIQEMCGFHADEYMHGPVLDHIKGILAEAALREESVETREPK